MFFSFHFFLGFFDFIFNFFVGARCTMFRVKKKCVRIGGCAHWWMWALVGVRTGGCAHWWVCALMGVRTGGSAQGGRVGRFFPDIYCTSSQGGVATGRCKTGARQN